MDRGRPFENHCHLLRVPRGNPTLIEILPQPIFEQLGTIEGAFHRELLVEKHSSQQREAIGCEESVGFFGFCEVKEIRAFHPGQP
jgi:hypothetical protein